MSGRRRSRGEGSDCLWGQCPLAMSGKSNEMDMLNAAPQASGVLADTKALSICKTFHVESSSSQPSPCPDANHPARSANLLLRRFDSRPAPPNSSRSKATDLVGHSSHRRSTNELLIPLELLSPSRGNRDPGNCAARLLASRICVWVISPDRLVILSRPRSSPPSTASLYQV